MTYYQPGEIAYDLDATERGPWFIVYGDAHRDYFAVSLSGTWEGTVKLVTKSPSGTVVDVEDASWTVNVGEKQILTRGGQEYAFDFTRSSGTVSCLAYSPALYMDWSNAITLEGMTGLVLLETSKPVSLE